MNDRMDDLHADIEMGEMSVISVMSAQQPDHMNHFFREVECIKEEIEKVKKATKSIGDINELALQATTTKREKEISGRLRPLVDETNKRAKNTKEHLSLLKEENTKLKKERKAKVSDLRVRENLCNTLTRKFIDEMKAYQNAQQKYKTDIKQKVKRQVQIVQPDATEEDIDEVMRSEGGRDSLYQQRILDGRINDSVKTTYDKVAGKYQDVLALEQSIALLQQMFIDLALLTEQQGETLDQIEYQMKEANDHVEDGNAEVYESIEIQKRIRKKNCWILLIVAIIAAVLFLYFFVIKN